MKQTKVLAVENDPEFSAVLNDALATDYDLTCYHSGEGALLHYSAIQPDILLLGIDTNGFNAFELCQTVKAVGSHAPSSVVFLANRDSVEECLHAYEVGGDDYITKPIGGETFKAKICAIERFQHDKKGLLEKAVHSHLVAIEWMKETYKYGLVVEFLKQSFSADDLGQLTKLLFAIFENLGLDCRIQIRKPTHTISLRSGNEICSPIEERALSALSSQGKLLHHFHDRAIFNEKHVSVLVLNMPRVGDDKYYHLADMISVLVGGLESRVLDLLHQSAVREIIAEVNTTMSTLEKQIGSQEKNTLTLIDNLLFDMSQAVDQLDVGLENEAILLGPVEKWMAKLVKLNVNAHSIDFYFARLLRQLNLFVKD